MGLIQTSNPGLKCYDAVNIWIVGLKRSTQAISKEKQT